MVVKKDGAEMTCNNCGTDLICRKKEYGGNFAATLQWQNFDGTAHYKTTDGKNFTCNIPEEDLPVKEDPAQTKIPTTENSQASINLSVIHTLDEINLKLDRMDEVLQAIFRYTVDEQLKKK